MTLLTSSHYVSRCAMDVTYYPFDVQQCELMFGSWTMDITKMNLSLKNGQSNYEIKVLDVFTKCGMFELKSVHAERYLFKDPCCKEEFPHISYFLLIWRRPTFFLFNYIQPAVLINILALLVFLIPAESGEKITLGISTMLSMIVFLMTIMMDIPPTDDIPVISVYYAFTMLLTTTATVLGVISLRIHHNGQRGVPVPPRLRECIIRNPYHQYK